MNKLMSAVKICRKRKANNTDAKQYIVSASSFLRLRMAWPTSKWEVDRELGANNTFEMPHFQRKQREADLNHPTASAAIVTASALEGSWLEQTSHELETACRQKYNLDSG
jgi:hypothetical protein